MRNAAQTQPDMKAKMLYKILIVDDSKLARMAVNKALNALYPPERRIVLPARYTLCGGPALIAALDYLTELLTRLAQSPTMRTN